jgi:hypothetical protein
MSVESVSTKRKQDAMIVAHQPRPCLQKTPASLQGDLVRTVAEQ